MSFIEGWPYLGGYTKSVYLGLSEVPFIEGWPYLGEL